jgi:hypothetical protein
MGCSWQDNVAEDDVVINEAKKCRSSWWLEQERGTGIESASDSTADKWMRIAPPVKCASSEVRNIAGIH